MQVFQISSITIAVPSAILSRLAYSSIATLTFGARSIFNNMLFHIGLKKWNTPQHLYPLNLLLSKVSTVKDSISAYLCLCLSYMYVVII